MRVIRLTSEVWISGADAASELGYKNPNNAIKEHVGKEDKTRLCDLMAVSPDEVKSQVQEKSLRANYSTAIYINRRGLACLITSSRLPSAPDFLREYKTEIGIDVTIISRLYKEQETIGQLMKAFARKPYICQCVVGKYKIDMYFPEANLAIECDENGHSDRNAIYEEERESWIKTELKCRFYRFNPDAPNFDIFDVINDIGKLLDRTG